LNQIVRQKFIDTTSPSGLAKMLNYLFSLHQFNLRTIIVLPSVSGLKLQDHE